MKKAFLDLDGTLIDSSLRHVMVMKGVLEQEHINVDFNGKDYIDYKSCGKSTLKYLMDALGLRRDCAEHLTEMWISKIESDIYLTYDTWFDDVDVFLQYLSNEGFEIIALTARKKFNYITDYVMNGQYGKYFKYVKVVNPLSAIEEKKEYIFKNKSPETILVGDTEVELESGKAAGINTYILNRGFRNQEFWSAYKDIVTYGSLIDVIKVLKAEKEGINNESTQHE